MVLKQLVVFADSDVSLRLETVADQAAISSNTVSPAPLKIRRSTIDRDWSNFRSIDMALLTFPSTLIFSAYTLMITSLCFLSRIEPFYASFPVFLKQLLNRIHHRKIVIHLITIIQVISGQFTILPQTNCLSRPLGPKRNQKAGCLSFAFWIYSFCVTGTYQLTHYVFRYSYHSEKSL